MIKEVNTYIGNGIGDHLNAIAHLEELAKAKNLDEIPMKWRTLFNGYIGKVENLDVANEGYISVYHEIEAAFNIYKLSTSKMAVEYGLGKYHPRCHTNSLRK